MHRATINPKYDIFLARIFYVIFTDFFLLVTGVAIHHIDVHIKMELDTATEQSKPFDEALTGLEEEILGRLVLSWYSSVFQFVV